MAKIKTKLANVIISEQWALDALQQCSASLHPLIVEAIAKIDGEVASQYRDIAQDHIDKNFIPNLAPMLAQAMNGTMETVLVQLAKCEGERQVVTEVDDKGRITEMIKVPIWATAQ